jgi:hypothetical protein
MDEFSWFVGLYEGEGSLSVRKGHKTVKGKRYEFINLALAIKMTDEDVIARAAEFLGISYHPTERNVTARRGHKPLWRVVKCGNHTGSLRGLLDKMYPYLSKRRQEQIDEKLQKAELILEGIKKGGPKTSE